MTRLDGILIALLAVVALATWPVAAGVAAGGPARDVVMQGPSGVTTVPLDRDATYDIAGARGTVHVVVKDGSVAIGRADCPDHVCVHTGRVSAAGSSIACVPNRVIVRLSGTDADGLDARIR